MVCFRCRAQKCMILCHVILTTTTKTVPILQIRKLRPSEVKEGISPITFQALGLQLHVVCTHFLPAAPSPEGLHSSQSSALIPSQRMLWGPTLQYLISSNSTGRLLPSQRRLGWDVHWSREHCAFPCPQVSSLCRLNPHLLFQGNCLLF